jgi:putative flippase GtrA
MNLSVTNGAASGKRGRSPMRYLVAAGLNTAFGFAIYPILLWTFPLLQKHYLIALMIAQATSLCFAYANYKLGVFQTRGRYAREITAFASFYLVNYAANWIALPAMVEFGHVSPIIAQLIFSVFILAGSYFWHSRITFKDAQ